MLIISKLTDYAVVIATHLVANGEPRAARDLALRTEIPEPTVSKVLKCLSHAGLVVSQRGAKGGYTLACLPEQIGIHEIIEALEGPIAVTEYSDDTGESPCGYASHCGVRLWRACSLAAYQFCCAQRKALAQITLADMVRPEALDFITISLSSEEAEQRRRHCQSNTNFLIGGTC